MSLRAGIITHYHNSTNYGGTLQAYALCKVLEKKGCCPSQIRIDTESHISARTKFLNLMRKSPEKAVAVISKFLLKKMFIIPFNKKKYREFNEIIKTRKESFEKFRDEKVPQSNRVYNLNNVNECLRLYDVFITGSDQVWHPLACNSAYLLDFVPEVKPKFSYAASLSTNHLGKAQQLKFQQSLKNYIGISVREEDAVELLKPVSPMPPVCSLDPTLLLGQNEWDNIASDRIINEPYVFGFFLGNGKKQKKIANEYAKKHNLRYVTIPFLSGKYNFDDFKYSDLTLKKVAPEDFISLIKYSDMVFTNSFHAVAFSSIYKKEFFAFDRNSNKEMSTRIENITKLFGTYERFLHSKNKINLSYIERCSKLRYDDLSKFEIAWRNSMQYLDNSLKKSELVLKDI